IKAVMGRVLMVALHLAGIGIERDRRVRVKIVARPFVANPWSRIPGAPVSRVCRGIIDPGEPGRSPTAFIRISFPCIPTRFVRSRYRVGFPDTLSGRRIERSYGAPNAHLPTGVSDNDFAAHRERRQSRITARLVVI